MSEPVPFDTWAVAEIERLSDLVGVLLEARGIAYDAPERPAVESIASVVHRAISATRSHKELRRDENGEIVEIIERRVSLEPDLS